MAALFDKGNLLTGTQPVDSALSSTSEFPLQNKVIKQNFDSITTTLGGKVNTSDIKNNLTSTDTDKPLSAYQGKVLDDKITTVSVNLTNTLSSIPLSATNLNANDIRQFLSAGYNVINAPVQNGVVILTIPYLQANHNAQICMTIEAYAGMWIRYQTNSTTWSAWRRVNFTD